MTAVSCLHLVPDEPPPELEHAGYFKAVLVADVNTTPEWQAQIADWLVRSGCRYMMAWGCECSTWHDEVDLANLRRFDFGHISERDFVMTKWHERDPLSEVFSFAANAAGHPLLELEQTYIIDIGPHDRAEEIVQEYWDALQTEI